MLISLKYIYIYSFVPPLREIPVHYHVVDIIPSWIGGEELEQVSNSITIEGIRISVEGCKKMQ